MGGPGGGSRGRGGGRGGRGGERGGGRGGGHNPYNQDPTTIISLSSGPSFQGRGN